MSGRGVPSAERGDRLGAPLWDGRPGRVEVWYATFTDAASGRGYWLHYERVAPTPGGTGAGQPYAHGWAAVFAGDEPPRCERFGPEPVSEDDSRGGWLTLDSAEVGPGMFRGEAGGLSWDLTFDDRGPPLFTFGRTVWERRLLPAAQCVPWATAVFRGRFNVDGVEQDIEARGAVARIYGHSNAERWCWLHADLGEGGVLELVSATGRRPALRRLRPLAMVQLRLPGEPDRPRHPGLAAPRLRTRIGESGFTVAGRLGSLRLEVEVDIPPERAVALLYTDPDGSTATCTNSEVASASVVLRRRGGTRAWDLAGTAHAEIGRRP